MKNEPNIKLDQYRIMKPSSPMGKNYGAFMVGQLWVISSGTEDIENGWEHVSVSLPNRTPTWGEMNKIKDLFWGDRQTVIQFHPKGEDYVNIHPNCLHLWRKNGQDFETPPEILV